MKRKPSRELKTAFLEPQRALEQNRLSIASGKPISEKGLTTLFDHSSHEHSASGSETPTAREPGSGPLRATSALLTDEDVREYQKLYKARFGKDITYDQAHEQGVKLVRLMELIYRPISLDEYQRLQQRRHDTGQP